MIPGNRCYHGRIKLDVSDIKVINKKRKLLVKIPRLNLTLVITPRLKALIGKNPSPVSIVAYLEDHPVYLALGQKILTRLVLTPVKFPANYTIDEDDNTGAVSPKSPLIDLTFFAPSQTPPKVPLP